MLKKQLFTLFLVLMAAMTAQAQPYCNSIWGGAGFPSDPVCEASVCSNDPYCCSNAWDGICASEAYYDSNCIGCLGFTNTHPYCNEYGTGTGFPADMACQNSVCSYDDYCCTVQWDALCASEAASDANCESCRAGCVPTSYTTTATACGQYYWDVTGLYYHETGNYSVETDCHTEYLDLTIIPGTEVSLDGTTDVCVGGVIGLVATGGNQYQWSGPNGYTNVGNSISRSAANTTMSGTYYVTITNNECSVVLSIEVTVHPKPTATLSGATSVCSGGTIMLTAPSGAATYQWSGPGGFTSNTGDVNTLVRTPANTTMSGVYKVTVTNAGGCTATASRTVTVAAPTTAAISGAASFCAGSMITLTATTAGASYQWSGPGGYTQSGATLSRGPATSAMAGTYTVTVTNASGCISTASKTITISAVPNVTITNNSNCTRIWLIASGGSSYSWSGPSYSGVGNTVLRNPATSGMFGTYTVTVTGSGGCTASASITVSSCGGGVSKNGGVLIEETLKAFPNPTNGISTVSFTAPANEPVRLSVYGIDGKEIVELFNGTTETDTTYQLEFDATGLPTGIYLAILRRADGSTEQIRILVTK